MRSKARILVVDDNRSLVRVYERLLQKEGYVVFTAYDGEDGLRKVRWDKPDLIILDIIMPKMNGYEVFRRLKSDPDIADIPVLMLTRVKERPTGLNDVVALDFLSKPVAAKEMLDRVKALLWLGDSST